MRYEDVGEELSYETALIQAAKALDLSGRIAFNERNDEALHELAGSWIKLADFLVSLTEHEEKKELDKKPEREHPVGFGLREEKEDDERD